MTSSALSSILYQIIIGRHKEIRKKTAREAAYHVTPIHLFLKVMMTKKGYTQIVYFMTPREQGFLCLYVAI